MIFVDTVALESYRSLGYFKLGLKLSSYVVLARKYRSQQFADIVGQQSVVKTLVNSIKLHRTHHAYVFSGSRGIGKTSIARIFSKALRCQNVKEEKGLLVTCNQCADCLEIMNGTSMNVLEIDGASNNGVDSIREIRENVKFLPSSGQYKIYIIDEVHMLSNQAFNALLKTLEEPPEHVVFIFATTEAHKIPETILGRCQRFDFKRVTPIQIIDHLKNILSQENVEYEEAALHLIARAAEGSMRDALSLLDQVISFSGLKVTSQAVRESIGLMGFELVYKIFEALLKRDAKTALQLGQDAFSQGVDLKLFLNSMIEFAHANLTIQATQAKQVSDLESHLSYAYAKHEIEQMIPLSKLRPLEELELIFQVLHHGLNLVAQSGQPKLVFDVLLIKCALAETLVEATEPHQAPTVQPATTQSPTVQPATTQTSPDPSSPQEDFLELVFSKKPMIGVILEAATDWKWPKNAEEALVIEFNEKDQMKVKPLSQKPFKDELQQLAHEYFGFQSVLEIKTSAEKKESLIEKNERLENERREDKVKKILNHQVIQEARSLFGSDLSNIEFSEDDS